MNIAVLVGNVGDRIRFVKTESGVSIGNFSFATHEVGFDKEKNQPRTDTDWHTITVFGKLADFVETKIRKGDKLTVKGQLKYRKHTGKDGVARVYPEIKADTIDFMMANEAEPS